MKYPQANALVCRSTFNSLKDSCFADLQWAARRLKVWDLWAFTKSPLEATYLPTGQKILFRGLDDPHKITSIAVPVGVLCFGWIEECYQIDKESDFDMLDESLRGTLPEGLYWQWTLTFNPWNGKHWLKARFFDNPSEDIFAATTTYLMNEFIDDRSRAVYEQQKITNPRRYQVTGLGEWGVVEGHIYDMFSPANLYTEAPAKKGMRYIAIDYGTVNPMVLLDIWHINGLYYVAREYYFDSRKRGKRKTDGEYAADLKAFIGEMSGENYPVYLIIDPSAASFKLEIRRLGLRVKDADNAVLEGIRLVSNLLENKKLYIHTSCKNLIMEFGAYMWDIQAAERGKEQPIKANDHALDALRYFCKSIVRVWS